jgi:cell wall-associated NlpC family hydrolase
MLSNNGRHRATSSRTRTQRIIASAGLAGVGLAVPLMSATTASAATVSTWDKVANCESTNNWSIDTGNGFYGGLQFTPSTWAAYGGTQYASSANLATKDQQIAVAEKVLASQGPGAWPVCGPQAGLTAGGAPAQVNTSSSSSSVAHTSTPAPVSHTSSAPTTRSSGGSTASRSVRTSAGTYTVVAGDWLSTIAEKEHVSGGWQHLYALNHAELTQGPDVIYPGQTLKLGSTVTSSSSDDSSFARKVEAAAAAESARTSGSSSHASSGSASSSDSSFSQKVEAAAEGHAAAQGTSVSGSSAASGSMAAAISFAEAQVGDAYVYGGSGPNVWDCSGLAQATLAKAGISAPRTSEEQAAASTRVSLSSLQPGDLLFWSSDGTDAGAYHVAIYTGNGAYVEAANPSAGVKTDTIANWAPTFAGRIG